MLLKFEYPLILVAVPLVIGLLAIMEFRTKKTTLHALRSTLYASFCLRSLIIILLVFMVAGFRIKAPPQNLCRIYLIDDSASVFLDKDRLLASINDNIKQLGKNDVSRILYLTSTDKTVTNIERGLLSAKGMFPAGYRNEIFLFTDGNQTEGDAGNVIPVLKQEGITLYTIPIGPKEAVDIKVDSVEAPKFVREGQPIELKCRVASTINTKASIQILGNGELVRELDDVSLLKSQDNPIVITLPSQVESIETYEIRILSYEFNERVLENNIWKEVIQKMGKPKVLYISEPRKKLDRAVPQIVKSSAYFEFDTIRSSKPIDRFLYDVIILDDIPMIDEIVPIIESFVSNGRGMLVVGGQNSFGLANYQNSELEKILPVYATPPEDLSLVVILDASGSMDELSEVAGKTKFQVASEALEDSVLLLSKIDRLEVIVFNQGYETIIPLQSTDNIISKLEESSAKVKPTGPTAILPPLQKAMDTLSSMSSAKKHIILLSDGHSTTNEPLDGFKQIAEKLGQNNITISVIATGEHINESTLKALTNDGGLGRIYRLNNKDKDNLTKNLKADLSVNKEFYRQAESLPVNIHVKDDVLKGIEHIPVISGYNRTTLKPNARLVASIGDKEPLLADWQFGLGKVMVLTTSLDSQWMGSWTKWEGLGQMITQALRYLTVDIDQNQLSNISTEALDDGRIKLKVDAPDNLELVAQFGPLIEKVTDTQTVRLAQIAAGKYEAILSYGLLERSDLQPVRPRRKNEGGPVQKEGPVISIFSKKDGNNQLFRRVPVVTQYSKEWRRFTPDTGFLNNLAESSGGKLFTSDEFTKGDVQSAVNNKSEPTYRNINAMLILAALGVFLADLLIRR